MLMLDFGPMVSSAFINRLCSSPDQSRLHVASASAASLSRQSLDSAGCLFRTCRLMLAFDGKQSEQKLQLNDPTDGDVLSERPDVPGSGPWCLV